MGCKFGDGSFWDAPCCAVCLKACAELNMRCSMLCCSPMQLTDRESKTVRLVLWRVPKPSEKVEQGPNYASECCIAV